MRCVACNRPLTNQESTRKFTSGTFTDLCNKCLETISDDVETQDSDVEDEEGEEE